LWHHVRYPTRFIYKIVNFERWIFSSGAKPINNFTPVDFGHTASLCKDLTA
jgi:hypothetical protein